MRPRTPLPTFLRGKPMLTDMFVRRETERIDSEWRELNEGDE